MKINSPDRGEMIQNGTWNSRNEEGTTDIKVTVFYNLISRHSISSAIFYFLGENTVSHPHTNGGNYTRE